jgi:hypothetical protein
MTRAAAIEKARRFLIDFWDVNESDMLDRLSSHGGTEEELAESMAHSRETLHQELRNVEAHINAIWFTGEPGIH